MGIFTLQLNSNADFQNINAEIPFTPFIWSSAGGREVQANMEETDRERLPWVEAHDSWLSRKEHLQTRCKICYVCSLPDCQLPLLSVFKKILYPIEQFSLNAVSF